MIYYSFLASVLFVFSHRQVKGGQSKKDEGLSVILDRLIEAGGTGNGRRYPNESLKRHSVAEETVHGVKPYHASNRAAEEKKRDLATLISIT